MAWQYNSGTKHFFLQRRVILRLSTLHWKLVFIIIIIIIQRNPCRLLDLNTYSLSLDEEIPYFTVIKELSFHYKQYCFFTIIKLK